MEYNRLKDFQSEYYRQLKIESYFEKLKFFFITLFFTLILFGIGFSFSRETTKQVQETKEPASLLSTEAINTLSFLYDRGYPVLNEIENEKYIENINGVKVVYTIDPYIQKRIYSVFKKFNVPYGAFIAIEPSTGKIRAFVTYSAKNENMNNFNQKADYPTASLFKLVTAAGVIEKGILSRKSLIGYEGNRYRLNRRKLQNNSRRDRNISSFENALGKSNNVIFGKIGANMLGYENLQKYADRFLFNNRIEFDFPIENSNTDITEDQYQVAKVSAGLTGAKISPIHASLIAAAIDSEGNMPRPIIVDHILNSEEKIIYQSTPSIFKKVISSSTAMELKKMMLTTIKTGTGAKIFKKYSKNMIKNITIGGKTGSLRGKQPPGRYEWFVGFAEEKNTKIAISSLIINNNTWHIKGTYMAQEALKIIFNYEL